MLWLIHKQNLHVHQWLFLYHKLWLINKSISLSVHLIWDLHPHTTGFSRNPLLK
jgi:hypothetical protein